MSKKHVTCIATSLNQADQIVERLRMANFSNNDISALFADKDTNPDYAQARNTKAPEGAVTGTVTAGIFGGGLGWIAGIGALAIPGVGPFIAAGPIMTALSDGAVGGITRGLIGLGIPEFEARRYEGKIKYGNILISVHTEDIGDIARAKDLFQQAWAQDICTAGEASPPKHNQSTERGPRPFEIVPA